MRRHIETGRALVKEQLANNQLSPDRHRRNRPGKRESAAQKLAFLGRRRRETAAVDRIHWLVESTTMENNSMEKGKAQNLLRREEVPDVFLCLLGVFVINIGYLAWTGRMPAFDGMADDQIMNTIAVLLLSGGTLCWVGFRQLLAPNRRCHAATGGSEMRRPLKITAFFALLVVAQALLVHFMGW